MFEDFWRLTLIDTNLEENEEKLMNSIQKNQSQKKTIKQEFTHIDLIKCQLTKLPEWNLFGNVLFLNLSFNNIETIDFELPEKLIYLSLSYNKIKNYDGIKQLKDLQYLEALSLKGNPISRTRFYRRRILITVKQVQILDDIKRTQNEIEAENHQSWTQDIFKKKFKFDISQILQQVDRQSQRRKINSQSQSQSQREQICDVKVEEKNKQEEIKKKRISFGKPFSDAKSFKSLNEDSFDNCSPIRKSTINDTFDSSYEKVLQGTIYDFSGHPQKVNLKKF